MFSYFFILLFVGIDNNMPGLGIAIVAFIFLQIRRVNVGKSLAYCCFLFAGAVVANWQLVILSEQGGEILRWTTGTTDILVGTLSVIALAASFRILKTERPLIVIFALTAGLAILWFSSVPDQLLNWYARLYVLACFVIPLLILVRSWTGSAPPRD
jgi:hypothetical protein